MRRPNTRPTLIYWLIDTRPETIAAGWPVGKPFYCGKTVKSANARLSGHFSTARRRPDRVLSQYLRECGETYVRTQVMETVPADGDWAGRERHWIGIIKFSFPALNICEGGEGVPGLIPSAAHRAKLSAASKGKKHSDASIAKMRAVQSQRSDEWRANASKAQIGKTHGETTKQKLSALNRGKTMPDEVRQKISNASRGRKLSDDARAKMSFAKTGKYHSSEHRQRNSEAKLVLWQTAEYRNKLVAAHSGKQASEETKRKMREAQQRRRQQEAAQHA